MSSSPVSTAPPLPSSQRDIHRQRHTRLRRSIMYDEHEEALKTRCLLQVGKERFIDGWGGTVDMSSNVANVTYGQKAVMYDQEPSVTQDGGGDVGAFIGPDGLVVESGYWLAMQRVQRDALALRTMFVRPEVDLSDGRLVARPVFPDLCTAKTRLGRIVQLEEAREYTHPDTGELEWCRDVFDIRGSEPVYRVVRASDGTDRSELYLGGKFEGRAYPYRWANGAPFVPYPIHRAALSPDLWDAWTEHAVFDGTMQAAVYQTMFAHIMRTGSWPQRWAIGCVPAAMGSEDGVTGTVTDSAILLILDKLEDFEGQPTVGNFPAGAAVAEFQEAIAKYERRVAAMSDLNPADIQRMSGDPRSGYAIAITRDGQREVQRKFEPLFRRGDREFLRQSAAILNRMGGHSFPESGYRIEYRSLPKTPAELMAESEYLDAEVAGGNMDRVEAHMRRHPGISRGEAEAALLRIAANDNALTGKLSAIRGTDTGGNLPPIGLAEIARQIVQQVADGRLPAESAKNQLINMLHYSPEVANAMVDSAATFIPRPAA